MTIDNRNSTTSDMSPPTFTTTANTTIPTTSTTTSDSAANSETSAASNVPDMFSLPASFFKLQESLEDVVAEHLASRGYAAAFEAFARETGREANPCQSQGDDMAAVAQRKRERMAILAGDTESGSGGRGWRAWTALEMAQRGASVREVLEFLEAQAREGRGDSAGLREVLGQLALPAGAGAGAAEIAAWREARAEPPGGLLAGSRAAQVSRVLAWVEKLE